MEAKKLKRSSDYSPLVGAEHCPACWMCQRASHPLRTDAHHNGYRVFCAVCDACGLFIPI